MKIREAADIFGSSTPVEYLDGLGYCVSDNDRIEPLSDWPDWMPLTDNLRDAMRIMRSQEHITEIPENLQLVDPDECILDLVPIASEGDVPVDLLYIRDPWSDSRMSGSDEFAKVISVSWSASEDISHTCSVWCSHCSRAHAGVHVYPGEFMSSTMPAYQEGWWISEDSSSSEVLVSEDSSSSEVLASEDSSSSEVLVSEDGEDSNE